MTNEEILKEFEAIAKKLNLRDETISGVDERGMIWNFILTVVEKAREEGVREAKKKLIKLKVNEKVQNGFGNWATVPLRSNEVARNVAIDDALAALTPPPQ